MAEVVCARESVADGVLGNVAGKRAEGLERGDDDVAVLSHTLVAPKYEQERLPAYDCSVLLVHLRRDDQVHLTELVLEQHEDDALRRRRALTGDRETGVGDRAPV